VVCPSDVVCSTGVVCPTDVVCPTKVACSTEVVCPMDIECAPDVSCAVDRVSAISCGEWVAVIYDENWFPGIVEEVVADRLTVNFMSRSSKRFVWPDVQDRQTVLENGILCKIESPYPVTSRHFAITNNDEIDVLCHQVLSR